MRCIYENFTSRNLSPKNAATWFVPWRKWYLNAKFQEYQVGRIHEELWQQRRTVFWATPSSRLNRHWIVWVMSSHTCGSWDHIACSHSSIWLPLCWILVLAMKISHMGGKHMLGCPELPETFALYPDRSQGEQTLGIWHVGLQPSGQSFLSFKD